ncbi:hypothetical protein C8J56DRAFT_775380 [Mycena floridula]|nr:hypothetical protein C8J56DRAFT_775380 [Mycena floridula]
MIHYVGFRPLSNRFFRTIATMLVRAHYEDITAIPHTSVPIVKFRDPYSKIMCDLNVNDLVSEILC